MKPSSGRLTQVLVRCFPSSTSSLTPSKFLSLSSIPSRSHNNMIKCQAKLSRHMFYSPFWRWNCLHFDKKPKINFTKNSLMTRHSSSLTHPKGKPPPSSRASSKLALADSINLPTLNTRLRGSLNQSLLKIDPGMGSNNIDMHRRWFNHEATKDHVCPSLLSGIDHMRDPRLNKGLAFTLEERQALGIHGLIPPKFRTQEDQVKLCKSNVDRIKEDLDKYIFLNDLMDRNEHLFYRLLAENIVQMMPLVYTPTVGLACRKLGAIYRRARGLFITIHDKGHVFSVLKNWPETDVRAVVVTDGERILGLGDLGAQGMGIPVGKLSLYTALAGVKPHQCLPVLLDVGTNTKALREDPNYIGLRQERVVGQEYDELVDEFMEAVVKRYGQNTLIQFEDFAIHNAYKLLTKYQDKYCTFNDDIQGTAAVAVAGLSASLRITNTKMNDNTYLFLGAGGAATGISTLLVRAMVRLGISEKDAASRIWMVDADGLLCKSRTDIPEHKQIFVKDAPHTKNFHDIVKMIKPTTIIGASAQGGAFTKEILTTMGKLNERPVIFALSNPTDKAECTAADAYAHTEGRAIFASGSPFPPFEYKGKVLHPGQGNNSYIFPGVALGIIAAGCHHISDDVFLLAANTLAETVKDEDLAQGLLYPPLGTINKVSAIIAKAIVEDAYASGDATAYPEPENKKAYVKSFLYNYNYNESLPTTYPWPGIK